MTCGTGLSRGDLCETMCVCVFFLFFFYFDFFDVVVTLSLGM